jgi:hypothetical protein
VCIALTGIPGEISGADTTGEPLSPALRCRERHFEAVWDPVTSAGKDHPVLRPVAPGSRFLNRGSHQGGG